MRYHFKKGDTTPFNQLRIEQVWLEQGEIGEYRIRRRIRKEEDFGLGTVKYEYTTKYSKNDERAAAQDNMELNAPLTAKNTASFSRFTPPKPTSKRHGKSGLISRMKRAPSIPSILTPDSDKSRVEIEFQSKEMMDKWIPPKWLLAAIVAAQIAKI